MRFLPDWKKSSALGMASGILEMTPLAASVIDLPMSDKSVDSFRPKNVKIIKNTNENFMFTVYRVSDSLKM